MEGNLDTLAHLPPAPVRRRSTTSPTTAPTSPATRPTRCRGSSGGTTAPRGSKSTTPGTATATPASAPPPTATPTCASPPTRCRTRRWSPSSRSASATGLFVPIDDENCWRYFVAPKARPNPRELGGANLFSRRPVLDADLGLTRRDHPAPPHGRERLPDRPRDPGQRHLQRRRRLRQPGPHGDRVDGPDLRPHPGAARLHRPGHQPDAAHPHLGGQGPGRRQGAACGGGRARLTRQSGARRRSSSPARTGAASAPTTTRSSASPRPRPPASRSPTWWTDLPGACAGARHADANAAPRPQERPRRVAPSRRPRRAARTSARTSSLRARSSSSLGMPSVRRLVDCGNIVGQNVIAMNASVSTCGSSSGSISPRSWAARMAEQVAGHRPLRVRRAAGPAVQRLPHQQPRPRLPARRHRDVDVGEQPVDQRLVGDAAHEVLEVLRAQPLAHGVVEAPLAVEVVIKRPGAHVRPAHDPLHPGAGESVLGELAHRGAQYPLGRRRRHPAVP